jgi:UDP-glucose 4-epimerase
MYRRRKYAITENAPIQVRCSIWKYKQIGEEIITDTAKVTGISAILLRYFNPYWGASIRSNKNYH